MQVAVLVVVDDSPDDVGGGHGDQNGDLHGAVVVEPEETPQTDQLHAKQGKVVQRMPGKITGKDNLAHIRVFGRAR